MAAPEVSIVLLQTGSAEKHFLTTSINAYLRNSYLFNCILNLVFFTAFVCHQTDSNYVYYESGFSNIPRDYS